MYTLYEDPFLKGLSAASLICYNFFSTIVTIYVFIVYMYDLSKILDKNVRKPAVEVSQMNGLFPTRQDWAKLAGFYESTASWRFMKVRGGGRVHPTPK